MIAADQFWHKLAKCVGQTDAFYDDSPALVGRAKAICAECPVTRQCLETGMDEPLGVWGGLTPKERRKLAKRQERAAS